MDRYRTLCFASWAGTGMFAFGSWQGSAGFKRLELTVANVGTTGYHCKELPVPRGWNSWFPTWEPWVTIARNCRFPEVGTPGSQPGNHGLPLQATAGSQRLELLVPNLGTMGYHCKQLPVTRDWNWWFPTWEPKVTMARNCRSPDVETYGSQPGNQRLPLQRIDGSQRLELYVFEAKGYHCKELRVPKAWNSWFQTWKSIRYQWKDLLIPKS